MSRSSRLIAPVRGPTGRVWLSEGQWVTYQHVRTLAARGEGSTLRILAERTGANRGRVHDHLARLRWHGLIGFTRASAEGGLRFWVGPNLRPGTGTRAFSNRRVGGPFFCNGSDSTSPSGGFLTGVGVRRAHRAKLTRSRKPPGSPDRYRRSGPHRGRPPRVVWGRCPSGHRLRSGRRSWTWGAEGLSAAYAGHCRRCAIDVDERLRLPLDVELDRPATDDVVERYGPLGPGRPADVDAGGRRRCDERCWGSTWPDCDCPCGGSNHARGVRQVAAALLAAAGSTSSSTPAKSLEPAAPSLADRPEFAELLERLGKKPQGP